MRLSVDQSYPESFDESAVYYIHNHDGSIKFSDVRQHKLMIVEKVGLYGQELNWIYISLDVKIYTTYILLAVCPNVLLPATTIVL